MINRDRMRLREKDGMIVTRREKTKEGKRGKRIGK